MTECQTGNLRRGHLQLIFSSKHFSPLVLALLNILWLPKLQFIKIKLQDSIKGRPMAWDQCERVWDPTGNLLCSWGHGLSYSCLPVKGNLYEKIKTVKTGHGLNMIKTKTLYATI